MGAAILDQGTALTQAMPHTFLKSRKGRMSPQILDILPNPVEFCSNELP